MSDRVFARIEAEHGLGRDRVMFAFSHNHCAPRLGDDLLDYYPEDEEQERIVARYTDAMVDRCVEIVGLALDDLAPAELRTGAGRAGFAVNRRENPKPGVAERIARGEPLAGPTDHAVPVMTVTRPDGRLAAILFGYACHPTTLKITAYNGDYPGFAQAFLERSHPGTTALFVNTCGGDQNPLPRRSVELCERYGLMLAAAVEEVLRRPLEPVAATLRVAFGSIDLAYERVATERELEVAAADGNATKARWARRMLRRLRAGETFPAAAPYPLHAWRLGDDTLFIGMGGETVVDYALLFKRTWGPRTWVLGYTNDMLAYIPSRRVWEEGGYEGGAHIYEYGNPAVRWAGDVEGRIVPAVTRLVAATAEAAATGTGAGTTAAVRAHRRPHCHARRPGHDRLGRRRPRRPDRARRRRRWGGRAHGPGHRPLRRRWPDRRARPQREPRPRRDRREDRGRAALPPAAEHRRDPRLGAGAGRNARGGRVGDPAADRRHPDPRAAAAHAGRPRRRGPRPSRGVRLAIRQPQRADAQFGGARRRRDHEGHARPRRWTDRAQRRRRADGHARELRRAHRPLGQAAAAGAGCVARPDGGARGPLTELGITSIVERKTNVDGWRAFVDLKAAGRLPVRSSVTIGVEGDGTTAGTERFIRGLPFGPREGDEHLRVGPLKIAVDGGVLYGTAYLREPYGEQAFGLYGIDDPQYRGLLQMTAEQVHDTIRTGHRLGWPMCAHVTGDAGVDIVLDAVEAADRDAPIADRRFTLLHAYFPSPETAARCRRLGVCIDTQPAWYYEDGDALADALGGARLTRFLGLRIWRDAGLPVAINADHMMGYDPDLSLNPFNPFLTMATAITRRTESGRVFGPDQRVGREEALRMMTVWPAWTTGEEREKGTLEVGKFGDLAVLTEDFFACPEERIPAIRSALTVVGGCVVHRADPR